MEEVDSCVHSGSADDNDGKHIVSYVTNPGPVDNLVLYDQESHVSSAIWKGKDRGVLKCYDHTLLLDTWVLTPQQIDLVERAGFKHLSLNKSYNIDKALISALVERWRKETNTFHMPFGEMTVTLEDVALLLGLSIDGEPITGKLHSSQDSICAEYLGRSPGVRGGMVNLNWLKYEFSVCPEDASLQDIVFHTRAYLLCLVGSTIFSNSTKNIQVTYLTLFKDFDVAGKYAWGAAALCWLYRALGNASLISASSISCYLTLLQCWSYYHLSIGRPEIHGSLIDNQFPLALCWTFYKHKTDSTLESKLHLYRRDLDCSSLNEVNWCPYAYIPLAVLPQNITRQLALGRSRKMLICFDSAEWHLPDRCTRQFGMPQTIPRKVERRERKKRRKQGPNIDDSGGLKLSEKMKIDVEKWENRHLLIVEAKEEKVDEDEYMNWYLKITRRWIRKPILHGKDVINPIYLPCDNATKQQQLSDTIFFEESGWSVDDLFLEVETKELRLVSDNAIEESDWSMDDLFSELETGE